MKTIPEWFKLLPCAARKKATRNLIKTYGYVLKSEASCLIGALGMSFTWSESKQGFEYWYKISYKTSYKTFQNAEIN